MTRVVVTFWGGARAAAGCASEQLEADTVADALAVLRDRHPDPGFARVLTASSVLVDGHAVRPDRRRDALTPDADGCVRLEVLPPFAGGA
ncbi:molybdopterin converting factor small subunit [Friedmanniella endophytica]|uniref:Molybdopterin converting factor small subunit n=1 Tax=Microlunatus kandeliicorticis TaxID=1759536 RepID=A0A7W3P7K2_9ACTN|nr:MoaD/ThiS family protein [Microlunatus kandeliicorticis]MBA8796216.1 molybdopterin converting factor small subunit [Microlunatus kandeliicorticis]